MEMSLWMQRSSSLLAEAAKKESFGERFQCVLPGVERGIETSIKLGKFKTGNFRNNMTTFHYINLFHNITEMDNSLNT